MSASESIEVTAPTVDQAITQALEQLGAHEDDVEIEVLSTPRAGVLGLGARQARVRVKRRQEVAASSGVMSPPPAPPLRKAEPPPNRPPRHAPPPKASRYTEADRPAPSSRPAPPPPAARAPVEIEDELEQQPSFDEEDQRLPADPEEQAREAAEILGRVLELMGEKASIERAPDSDAENLELNIKGDGSGILIGRHGQTLDALEYLVNRILARKLKDAGPISIDTESYRARRRQQLHRMALSKGEQAKREHVAVTLDPMPPRDRRIIHLALKDDPLITTRSSGEGFMRSIQIVPIDERREGSGGGGRGGRDRRRERDRDRERSTVGQQGGFKHGQKRIV